MIETGREATKALKEIKRATRWSYKTIARKLEVSYNTVWKLSKSYVDNPNQEVMDKIEALHIERCGQ